MTPQLLARARRHLVRRDPVLASVIRTVGRCTLADGRKDLFAGLVRSIVSQQLSAKASDTILERVERLLPDGHLSADALLEVPAPALRAAGLSTRKVEYVHDLCARCNEGFCLDDLHALDDEAVIERLTSIRGIGQWTAEMQLIFRLGRPDVLPLDDVGVQRAVQRVYGLRRKPTPTRLTRIAEPWRPYRSVACWYLWAALDGE
jgi:DNA-3-methyladenine glycosylase II